MHMDVIPTHDVSMMSRPNTNSVIFNSLEISNVVVWSALKFGDVKFVLFIHKQIVS
jgi:hypothetical protein